jgi:LysM repeat protein
MNPILPVPQPPPRPIRRQPAWLPWVLIGGATGFAFLIAVVCLLVLIVVYLGNDRIPQGVSVAGVDIGGQSAEDAATALEMSLNRSLITLTDAERQWPLALSELGIALDTDALIEQAAEAEANQTIAPAFTIDFNQTQTRLIALSEDVNIAPVQGRPGQNGRALDIENTLNRLYLDLNGEIADGVMELSMIDVEPAPIEGLATYNGQTTTHVVERGQELGLIARQYGVTIEDIVTLNSIDNANLIYPGQELVIPAGGEYVPEDLPQPPTNSGRAIVVSISQQRIYAFENGDMVRTHLVSTGRDETPTVLGDYTIRVKYAADDMSGPGYFLPQVPWTMYFYQGYAVHGTYWHNSFGRPMSHGCVNLPVEEAEWFFNFAQVGTPIRVVA